MLKIRLQRVGRKHEPKFRLVLTDSKNSTKSGKLLEVLGNYDSRHGQSSVFKDDRITYWISKGAQVSGTVHNLLIDKKIISSKKINVLPKKKPILKTEEGSKASGEAPIVETPVAETEIPEVAVEESQKEETPSEPVAEVVAQLC